MRRVRIAAVAVLLIAAAAYIPVLRANFVNYDDEAYVTANPHVQSGLTVKWLRWAFNVGYQGNWHPATWISHMLDRQFFGPGPLGPHAVNLLIHLANTLLLLLLLHRMTGSVRRSAFAAALFAVHPLHVESVAWVAERKDVLSALFWFLTMWAYARYTESPSPKRYLAVTALFALGLMSKPTLVTLPFVLLLIDYWPLGRWVRGERLRLIREKLPLLAMSLASGAVTYAAQQRAGAVSPVEELSLASRIANALTAYVGYVGKMLWPAKLAAFYPHAASIPTWHVLAAAVLLAAATILVIRSSGSRPYLAVGWFWYLIVLVPMIGLVQVGTQAMADRYTYISLIGLFIAIAWVIPAGRRSLTIAPIAAVAVLAVCTWSQAGHWRDSVTLWTHTLEVTRENTVAHYNLGLEMQRLGRTEEAVHQYEQAVRINPRDAESFNNLGEAYRTLGRPDTATDEYRKAIAAKPDYADAYNGLGAAYGQLGETREAIDAFREAVRLDPDLDEAQVNLAVALLTDERFAEAWDQVRTCDERGLRLPDGFVEALSAEMPLR